MKKNIAWVALSLLMAAALVLSSCQAAVVEEEKETETVAGKVTEKEAAAVEEEEEEEEVAGEAGPEMVTDPATGERVEAPRYGGTIISQRTTDMTHWDPYMHYDGGNTMRHLYDTLMIGDWSTPRDLWSFSVSYIPPQYMRGLYIDSWVQNDPVTYTLYMAKGFRFENKPPVNGRAVTAHDWKYSIDRLFGHGEFEEAGMSPNWWAGYGWEDLEEVEVIDDYTMVFHMREPNPMFTQGWGMERMPHVHARETVDAYGTGYTWEQAVSSGPWIVEDVVLGSSYTFKRNPQYGDHDPKYPQNQIPYADIMKELVIPDWSTTVAAFRTGKIDYLYPGLDDARTLWETNPELPWFTRADSCAAVWPRLDLEPYSDVKVRRAMQMAINLGEINEGFYYGTADPKGVRALNKVFTNVYTPFEELPEQTQEAFSYKPEKAKQLLAEAGYPDGFKQVIPQTGPNEMLDLFIAYWEAIGIETEIEMMESAAYTAHWNSGDQRITYWGYCNNWWPLARLEQYTGGQARISWNVGNTDDPFLNDWVDRILTIDDIEESDAEIKAAIVYITDNHWMIAGPHRDNFVFWQPWIRGYNGETSSRAWSWDFRLTHVWVDQDLKYELTGTRD